MDLFSHPRFLDLVALCDNDMERALGMLILFWVAAQRRWGHGELLPKDEFRKAWKPLLDSGMAELRPEGIYAKGADEQFGWYRERIAAARQGGLAKASKRVANATKQAISAAKRCPPTPTPTPPLTLPPNTEEEEAKTPSSPPPPKPVLGSAVDDFLSDVPERARAAWDDAYGAELVRAELPKARAGWLSDAVKQRTGNKAVYIRHWLQNALKTQKNAALRGPHAEFDIGQVIREREALRAKEPGL
jgi:hypothetical protein